MATLSSLIAPAYGSKDSHRFAGSNGVTRPARRAVVIANPIAGGGRSGRALDRVARGLERRGLEVQAERTAGRGDAARIASMAAEADLVVSMGGDGTLSEVVRGVVASHPDPARRPAVAMLPFGTGNGAVPAFRLHRHLERGLDALAAGHTVPVDVGVVSQDGREIGTMFLWLGVGVDAALMHAIAAKRQGPLGARLLGRVPGLAWKMFGYAFPALDIKIDGQQLPECVQVIVCNVGETAIPGFNVAPDADPGDGLFDVVTVTGRSWLGWLGNVAAVFRKRLPLVEGVSVHRGRHIEIRSTEPAPMHLDGDAAGFTPIEVSLRREAVRFVVPAS